MPQPIRVIQFGLGAIGQAVARLVLEKSSMQLVGAVDADPSKIGKDLSAILGTKKKLGVTVSADLRGALAGNKADIVIHTTGSRVPDVFPQFMEIIGAGLHCVTSAEEMLFPSLKHEKLAAQLGRAAKKAGVTLLGTGVNPGFVMDALPLALTAATQRVAAMVISRSVDVSTRRQQLQRKVGVGMTVRECEQMIAEGKFGHVGLAESAALVAHGLSLKPTTVNEETKLLVATRAIKRGKLTVSKGRVKGMKQEAEVFVGKFLRVALSLSMSADEEKPRDEIAVAGIPPVLITIHGGVAGDLATPAILVNTVPRLLHAPRGLITMLDVIGPRITN